MKTLVPAAVVETVLVARADGGLPWQFTVLLLLAMSAVIAAAFALTAWLDVKPDEGPYDWATERDGEYR